ncbi:putative disease resistance protein RGA3 [Nymphaea colorata]|uniref:R13L1/DRL21-like LRR repeat region domain-containing protein n=1 Tax=Nymphaea colorata TaxID=210225 RepID=A0A5K1AQ07_9MAGN|nr:putative disease resistance protein RGA3 [Nymphaea colorata]
MVLYLSGGNFTELPNSIGDLILLKHLNLTNTKIKELPASIGKLWNLLSLFLSGSEIKELPKEIGQLCNLRHLRFENTDQLEFVAEGLGKLTCLCTLSRFIICHRNKANVGCNVKELKNLINLKGELTIENMERITLINDASEALLQEKKDIESLDLSFGNIIIGEETSEEEEKIVEDQEHLLQQLQLPPNLRSLSLTRYYGKKLPIHWLDGCVHLETIKFQSCSWIEKLPSFSKLKRLHLYDCHHLKTLAASPCLDELVTDGCASFTQLPFRPKLESVELCNLDNWEGFEKGAEKYCIKTLEISNCLKVKRLPHLPNLQRLEINLCDELSALLEKEEEAEFELNMPALTELVIRGCHALVELPNMPILKSLTIEDSHKLKQLTFMGKLGKSKVHDCENWEGWSLKRKENEDIAIFMYKLYISYCSKLRTLPSFPALIHMKICDCEELHALWREDDQPIGLEVLCMCNCLNVSFQVDWLLPLTKIRDMITDWSFYGLHLTTSNIKALQRLKVLGLLGMPCRSLLPEWLWHHSVLESLVLDGATRSSWHGPWEKLKQLGFLIIGQCQDDTSLDGLFKHSLHSSDQATEEQSCPFEGTHFSVPPKLTWLSFIGCSKLKLLPDGVQHLVHLKFLTLENLPEYGFIATIPD